MKVQIELDPGVQMPAYSRVGDAAMDLRAHLSERFMVGVGRTRLIPTGIRIAVPKGHAALVLPRSGLSLKHGITIMNTPGLIDSNYRGEIMVILHNAGDDTFVVEDGDRIAQLLILPIPTIEWDAVEALGDTERGAQGFGSSGVK